MGVQKVALRFDWDYSTQVAQSYDWGRSMGRASLMSSSGRSKCMGTVVVNEGRRAKYREERRVVWDMDGGAYVAGLIGSSYFRVGNVHFEGFFVSRCVF